MRPTSLGSDRPLPCWIQPRNRSSVPVMAIEMIYMVKWLFSVCNTKFPSGVGLMRRQSARSPRPFGVGYVLVPWQGIWQTSFTAFACNPRSAESQDDGSQSKPDGAIANRR